ncbi:MAG: site-2 protease family protein [candidate division SR1 bacterium]|nr:site-2 protease family protein [candidate division SR1 bacterium]
MDFIIQTINILFWFIIILIPLVAIHEFGHFIFARLTGVKVLEFGIGIPPQWIRKRWKGVIWSLNYVLLGGFARIYGDHDAIDDAHETNKIDPKLARDNYQKDRLAEIIINKELEFFLEDNNIEYSDAMKSLENSGYLDGKNTNFSSEEIAGFDKAIKQISTLIDWEFDNKINSGEVFYNKNVFQKVLILLGGITFNLITAFLIFFLLTGFVGTQAQPMLLEDYTNINSKATVLSKSDYLTVFSVLKDSNAYNAGLRSGDYLVSFAGQDLRTLKSFDDFKVIVDSNKGKSVPLTYIKKDSGVQSQTNVELKESNGKALFGVNSQGFGYMVVFKAKDIGSAISLSTQQVWNIFKLNFEVLGKLVSALNPWAQDKSALQYVGGPVAVGSIGQKIFDFQGYKGVLNIMATVSVGLAAFNLIPLPALDGGRIVIVLLSRLTGRRNKKLEGAVISVTMFVLLGLGLVIAINDVFKISQGTLF